MVSDDEALCTLDDEDVNDAYGTSDELEQSVQCSELGDTSGTTTTTYNYPAGRPLNNDNHQFLSNDNHCCLRSFHDSESKDVLSGEHARETRSVSCAVSERLPHAGTATEVHAKRSLGLRGSAKCRGTDGALLATTVFTESLSNICMFNTELNIQRTPSLYGSSCFT